MAVQVVKSCDLILKTLGIESAEWAQLVSVKIPPTPSTKSFTTEQIQGVKGFYLSRNTPVPTTEEESHAAFQKTAEQIEALLAYSICSYYSKSKSVVFDAEAPAEFLRVLGFCPPDQDDINRTSTQEEKSIYERKREYFIRWSGDQKYPPII
jgi:hypothetical protein